MSGVRGDYRRTIVVGALAAAALWLLWRVQVVLLPFLLGAIIAYALEPLVAWAEGYRVSRSVAVVSISLLFVIALIATGIFGIPVIVQQVSRMASYVPLWAYRIGRAVVELSASLDTADVPRELSEAIRTGIFRLSLDAQATLLDFVTAAPGRFVALMGGALSLALVPVIAGYLLLDARRLRRALWRMVPGEQVPGVRVVLGELDVVLSGFIRGYLLVALIIGLTSGTLLALLGLRFYPVLGLVAGLTNLIPYFGPFIGAVPALVVAAFDSPGMVLWVAGAYVIIQQLESLFLSPRIIGSRTGLHPLAVVLAVVGGGSLAGIPGMIVGVPILGISRVLGTHLLRWALEIPGPWREV